jgi:hypothetical protein
MRESDGIFPLGRFIVPARHPVACTGLNQKFPDLGKME